MGKTDVFNSLVDVTEDEAKMKGSSAMIIVTPINFTSNNYISLLPQLDPIQVASKKKARPVILPKGAFVIASATPWQLHRTLPNW